MSTCHPQDCSISDKDLCRHLPRRLYEETNLKMTHAEIWDDSALVDSWNEALEEYKVRKNQSRVAHRH